MMTRPLVALEDTSQILRETLRCGATGRSFDALGTSLVHSLSEPAAADEAFEPPVVLDPATGVDLSALASAFHTIAVSGPEGARLAEQVLASVASFVRSRR